MTEKSPMVQYHYTWTNSNRRTGVHHCWVYHLDVQWVKTLSQCFALFES